MNKLQEFGMDELKPTKDHQILIMAVSLHIIVCNATALNQEIVVNE